MKEIKITEIENIQIGQIENTQGGTSCTVFVSKEGMPDPFARYILPQMATVSMPYPPEMFLQILMW